MASEREQLRLMAKIARLYHERGLRQTQIAAELHVSQPRVSRLLKAASQSGLVRTIVTMPVGVHTETEEALEHRYGLAEAVVVEAEDDQAVIKALAAALAGYLESTLICDEVIGISSWSESLLAMVDALRPLHPGAAKTVVQLVGGNGASTVQFQANRLLARLAALTGAEPVFLAAPGVLLSGADVESLLRAPSLHEATSAWQELTLALLGIGAVEPSPLARQSGNTLPEETLSTLKSLGAVGDICFRYFDAAGELVSSQLNDTVVGIRPDVLKQVPRRVGVAGGPRKVEAIRAALTGGWINIVVTDLATARALLG
jgi:DNA-binding transcriptional regulator LsrR (DeoR family)